MCFKFFRHKKKEQPRTFEGRFITDEEIEEMTMPKRETFIEKDMREIREKMDEIKKYVNDYGGQQGNN